MTKGTLIFTKNISSGKKKYDWGGKNWGVAFEGLNKDVGLFPVICGVNVTLSVNFGDQQMQFYAPDDPFGSFESSYKPLKDII